MSTITTSNSCGNISNSSGSTSNGYNGSSNGYSSNHGTTNKCIPDTSTPITGHSISEAVELHKSELKPRLKELIDFMDYFWCDHANLSYVVTDIKTGKTPDHIELYLRKIPCGCRGFLNILKREKSLTPLTVLSPIPFRKKGIIEVGVDEVGRGCLFGPVTAGAVVWPPNLDNDITRKLVKDSKKLTEAQREEAYTYIIENAISWGVASLDSQEIDRSNILKASIKAMHLAIDETYIIPDHVVADGNYFKFYMDQDGQTVSHTTVIEGDSKYYSIAAASIIAKVTRDRAMVELTKKHPELEIYGIASNKGYGAKVHTDAIKAYGLTKWHRRSFGPCKGLV